MNPAAFGSLPSDACALGTEGAHGGDRIVRNSYDDAGQLTLVERAVGTALEQDYARYTYGENGERLSVRDANNNRSAYVYDGHMRLCRLYFPVTTLGANAANTGGVAEASLTCASGGTNPDFEGYAYDLNGNRVTLRLRSGEEIDYDYDGLNREVLKDLPGGSSQDVYSAYDPWGRRLYAHFASGGGQGVDYTYDGLGRLATETAYTRTLTYAYDAASNRTRVTWPDAFYAQYSYDAANRMTQVGENGATSGAGLLAVYAYNNVGLRQSLTRGNGAVTSYDWDGAARLEQLDNDLAGGAANDVVVDFTYNPASQVLSRAWSTSVYDYTPPVLERSYTADGLNRYASVSGVSFAYDGRGNLTSDGVRSFGYDLENRLTAVSGTGVPTTQLSYDPLGRLTQITPASVVTSFLNAGDQLVAEFDNAGDLTRRYVHGAGVDEPLVWYEGASTTDRRYLVADHQGSIIAANGASTQIYSYSPYGEPDAWSASSSRFRYTGQAALPELKLYYYRARIYDPQLGRFLQTDPIGYRDDLNLYAYVRNDPMSLTDPSGMCAWGCDRRDDGERTMLPLVLLQSSGEVENVDVVTPITRAVPDSARDLVKLGGAIVGGTIGGLLAPEAPPVGMAIGRFVGDQGAGLAYDGVAAAGERIGEIGQLWYDGIQDRIRNGCVPGNCLPDPTKYGH